ncbi:hypothetical protein EOL70_05450 [Leucothrix sargassi]|nr:hypothetical protein EOL70_05450 [Leucothrix sargassi]
MPSKIKYLSAVIATALIIPSVSLAESNFSYDFFEVGISSTTDDDNSYTSFDASGSMEINNDHYITGHVKTDISGEVTENEIGIGIGAYKSSSEDMDYYSRAGVKHGKGDGESQQTLNVGFGARYQMSETIEIAGGIDALFSTHEDSSGFAANISALYEIDDKIKVGGEITTDGDKAETRLFTRVSTL